MFFHTLSHTDSSPEGRLVPKSGWAAAWREGLFCPERQCSPREAGVVLQTRKQSWGCGVWPGLAQGARTEVGLSVWSLEH